MRYATDVEAIAAAQSMVKVLGPGWEASCERAHDWYWWYPMAENRMLDIEIVDTGASDVSDWRYTARYASLNDIEVRAVALLDALVILRHELETVSNRALEGAGAASAAYLATINYYKSKEK